MTTDEVRANLIAHGLLEFVVAECRRRNVPADWVLGRERYDAVTRARHEIWFAVRETLNFSYPHIGRIFGVDHKSVMHGCARIAASRAAKAAVHSLASESDNCQQLGATQ